MLQKLPNNVSVKKHFLGGQVSPKVFESLNFLALDTSLAFTKDFVVVVVVKARG